MSTPRQRHHQKTSGNAVTHTLSHIGHGLENTASSIVHGTENRLSSIETSVSSAVSGAENFVGNTIFWVVVAGGAILWYNRDSVKSGIKKGSQSVFEDVKAAAPYAAAALLL